MTKWRAAFAGCSSPFFLALLLQLGCGTTESAATIPPVELTVRGAWVRAADSGATAALYFALINEGTTADTLTGVTSADAESASLHISTQHGEMMHMSLVTTLPVPAQDSVLFRPLGAHVMLTGLKRPLIEGDSILATLVFASGRTAGVVADVRRP